MDRTDFASSAAAVRAAAAAELEQLHNACAETGGYCHVIDAISLCAVHDLAMPEWLRFELIRRRALLKEARVRTLDEAYGWAWPAGTRLVDEQRRQRLTKAVYGAAWDLIQADLSRPINRDLFEEIGERSDIAISGPVAERRYYEALADGGLNIAKWRHALRASGAAPIPSTGGRSEDGSQGPRCDSAPNGH